MLWLLEAKETSYAELFKGRETVFRSRLELGFSNFKSRPFSRNMQKNLLQVWFVYELIKEHV